MAHDIGVKRSSTTLPSHQGARASRAPAHRVAAIAPTPRMFNFRYRSAAHFIEVFRTWYGPVHKAFAALPAEMAVELEHDLVDLLNGMNRAGPDSLVVPSEYLEVVVTRR